MNAELSQRQYSFHMDSVVVKELHGRPLEVWEPHQERVDVVQPRSRHLTDTPRPRQDLRGAEHNERVGSVPNHSEKKTEIFQVVLKEDLAVHLRMRLKTHFEQSRKAATPFFVMTKEELVRFLPLPAKHVQRVGNPDEQERQNDSVASW